MKEKLKALLAKLPLNKLPLDKLRVPDNLKAKLAPLAPLGQKLGLVGRILRFAVLSGVILGVAVSGALVVWFTLKPINSHRPALATFLREKTGAGEFGIGDLSWSISPKSLSLGVRARDVKIAKWNAVKDIQVPALTVAVQPLKLFAGRVALFVEAKEAKVLFGNVTPDGPSEDTLPLANVEKTTEELMKKIVVPFARWTWLSIKAPGLKIESQREHKDHHAEIKGDFDLSVSGIPGTFDLSFHPKIGIEMPPALTVKGTLPVSLSGYFVVSGKRVVGIEVPKFDWDFSALEIKALGAFEKSNHRTLKLSIPFKVLLSERMGVRSLETQNANFTYEQIAASMEASYNFVNGTRAVKWNVPRTQVEGLHLPIAFIEEAPVVGIIESGGEFLLPHDGMTDGAWRFGLNNLRIDVSQVTRPELARSKGLLNLSFATEGRARRGKFFSDRTELQLKGDSAQLLLFGGQLNKPAGDELGLFVKARLIDDRVSIDEGRLNLNTMKMLTRGTIDGIKNFLQGKASVLNFQFTTNKVDLTGWNAYFPVFRKIPLSGYVEGSGSVNGEWAGDPDAALQKLTWHVDRFNLKSIRGAFDREMAVKLGVAKDYNLSGPFSLDLLFQGRGTGSRIAQATLNTRVDLSKFSFTWGNSFRKPAGVPLTLELATEHTRNRMRVSTGRFQFHELDMSFLGEVLQGSAKSRIDIVMKKPVSLENWREFFLNAPAIPWTGQAQWRGTLGFEGSEIFEGDLDMSHVFLEGKLAVSNVNGRFGDLKNALRGGRGDIVFSRDGVTIPSLAFRMGESDFQVTGEAQPLRASKRKSVSAADLIAAKGWNARASLTTNRLDMDDFSPKGSSADLDDQAPEGPTLGMQLRAMLSNPMLRASSFDFSLQAAKGEAGGINFESLKFKALWDEGKLSLKPFTVSAMGGKLVGSARFDASAFYQSKDVPQLSFDLKTQNLDVNKVAAHFKPDFAPLVGGFLDGDAALATSGWETEDWSSKAKGRLSGTLRDGRFESLLFLRQSLGKLFQDDRIKNYLVTQVQPERCVQKNFNAQVDVSVGGGGLNIDRAVANFATGSALTFKGSVSSKLQLGLEGDFLAGAQCIGGSVRTCLAGQDGRSRLPFTMTGLATSPDVTMQYAELGRQIASCAAGFAKRKVEETVKSEVQKLAPQAEEKAREELKKKLGNLFK